MFNIPNQRIESNTDVKEAPRIALVGCGAIAEAYYLPALARDKYVLNNLILVDANRDRVQQLAAKFKIKEFVSDYHDILEDVHGVIIALPTNLHYPVSMEFLSKGVHVLCEKPLAESADKAQIMVEQAQKTGVYLAVNYLQRLYANFAKVKELLAKRILGEPLSIKYVVGEEFRWPTVSGFYFNSPLNSRGVLRDRGAHVLDHICWWLGGKPRLISCENDSFGGSDAVAHVRFEHNRCIGEVKLSWLTSFPCEFVVQCEAGIITGDVYDFQSLKLQTGSGGIKQIKLRSGGKSKQDVAYEMVTSFIQVVTGGENPLVSGHEVLDSIEFIDECYAAATRFDMPWYEIPEVHGAR